MSRVAAQELWRCRLQAEQNRVLAVRAEAPELAAATDRAADLTPKAPVPERQAVAEVLTHRRAVVFPLIPGQEARAAAPMAPRRCLVSP